MVCSGICPIESPYERAMQIGRFGASYEVDPVVIDPGNIQVFASHSVSSFLNVSF